MKTITIRFDDLTESEIQFAHAIAWTANEAVAGILRDGASYRDRRLVLATKSVIEFALDNPPSGEEIDRARLRRALVIAIPGAF